MSELRNFPFKNQLAQKNMDGLPDIDAHLECCGCCIASCIQFLTGREAEGEALVHAVYGKNYIGGTAAIMYASYVRQKYGVRLFPVSGNSAYLVEQIHHYLALGLPVVGTIPSTYLPPENPMNPGSSHCIAFYKDGPNYIAAMNPWQAFTQANTDAWWKDRLCFGQIWIAEKVENISMPVPSGWKDDGHTLIAPDGIPVIEGFRDHVLASAWHPDNIPLEKEGPFGDGTSQLFAGVRLCWDARRGVYEQYIGSDLQAALKLINHLKQNVASVAAVQQKADEISKVNEQLNAELDQKDAEIASLKAAPVPSPAFHDTISHVISELQGVLS